MRYNSSLPYCLQDGNAQLKKPAFSQYPVKKDPAPAFRVKESAVCPLDPEGQK